MIGQFQVAKFNGRIPAAAIICLKRHACAALEYWEVQNYEGGTFLCDLCVADLSHVSQVFEF